MAFAVVIVNHRSADLVSRCLDALPDTAEVVVVDNASRDGSVDALRGRHPNVTIVERAENGGFAAGVNAGFEATTAPFVILLNPDCVPRPGALERLVAHLDKNASAGVVAPRLVNADGSAQPAAFRRFPGLARAFVELSLPLGLLAQRFPRLDRNRLDPRDLPDGTPVAWAGGAALAIRRSAYEASGRFDEAYFMYFEEVDWQERVGRAGYRVEVIGSVEVVHAVTVHPRPPPSFLASARRYLTARGYPRRVVGTTITVALGLSRLTAAALASRAGRPPT